MKITHKTSPNNSTRGDAFLNWARLAGERSLAGNSMARHGLVRFRVQQLTVFFVALGIIVLHYGFACWHVT